MMVQPESLFALPETAALLAEEAAVALQLAQREATGRALLLGPSAAALCEPDWVLPQRPAVRLHVDGEELSGDVRCTPHALPWEDAAFRLVIVCHAGDVLGATAPLVTELARVLAPGGVLLWFALNPRSAWLPWCHWQALRRRAWRNPAFPGRFTGARTAARQLRGSRLPTRAIEYLGACWPSAQPAADAARVEGMPALLRAAYLVATCKRTAALTPLRARLPRRSPAHPQLAGTPSQRACA
jgi:SAM-dependent methyltransferase